MAKKNYTINITIHEWWIDWWRDDKNYVCMLIEIGDKLQYIARELKNNA